MADQKSFWLAAADAYVAACRVRETTLRASEFAQIMERSPVQLAREFQASVGIHVTDYFNACRIARARELLRTTDRTTAQIAAATGFGTPRTFYRAFRRLTGRSPTDYRKEMSLA